MDGEIAEEKAGKGCGAGFEVIVNSVEEFDFFIRVDFLIRRSFRRGKKKAELYFCQLLW